MATTPDTVDLSGLPPEGKRCILLTVDAFLDPAVDSEAARALGDRLLSGELDMAAYEAELRSLFPAT